MNKQLKINAINRTIGTLMAVVGIKKLRQHSNFTTIDTGNNKFYQALKSRGIKINFSPLDISYRYTSFDNWQKIIKVLNGIIKHFKWEANVHDCDNRSTLMTSLCSLIFRINTCAGLYCEVFDAETGKSKYLHWANLIVDTEDNIYLWDVDNGGMYQKITSDNCVMGKLKYRFISIRLY